MKVYRFAIHKSDKGIGQFYTLQGIKSALSQKYSWCNKGKYYDVIEYEAKEIKRLTVDEVKQLNTKRSDNLLDELLQQAFIKNLIIRFSSPTTGSTLDFNLNVINFNSLDEAIEIVNKY